MKGILTEVRMTSRVPGPSWRRLSQELLLVPEVPAVIVGMVWTAPCPFIAVVAPVASVGPEPAVYSVWCSRRLVPGQSVASSSAGTGLPWSNQLLSAGNGVYSTTEY